MTLHGVVWHGLARHVWIYVWKGMVMNMFGSVSSDAVRRECFAVEACMTPDGGSVDFITANKLCGFGGQ